MKIISEKRDFRKGGIRSIVFFMTILQGISLRTAGQAAERIRAGLARSGFENTRCTLSDEKCYVSIENHTWRWDARAIYRALDIIASELEASLEIDLLITGNSLPRLLVVVEKGDWAGYSMGQIGSRAMEGKIRVTTFTGTAAGILAGADAAASPAGRTELVIYPQVYFENTRIYQFYETQVNIAPALEVALWKGSRFRGQVIIPLQNSLGYEGDHIRPGLVTLSQDFRIFNRLRGSVSAGNFAGNNYGISAWLRLYLFRERFSLDLNTSLSGNSHYIDNEWIHGDLNIFSGSFTASWYFERYDLVLKAGGAKYINEDYGLFATCVRYFNETAVGLYAQTSVFSNNGGFFFSVPLCRKLKAPRRYFRVTLPPRYEMTYNAGTEYYYGQSVQPLALPVYDDRFTWPGSVKTMLLNLNNQQE